MNNSNWGIDINLEDIVFLIVLKGLVVVVLYGFCVLEGVIIIIIKKGQVGIFCINYSNVFFYDVVNKVFEF